MRRNPFLQLVASFAFAGALPINAHGQRPLNLDFNIPRPLDVPGSLGWFYDGDDGTRAGIDTTMRHAGARSLRLVRGDSTAPKYVTGFRLGPQVFPRSAPIPFPLAGKRLRFSGWIRTNHLFGGTAGFEVQVFRRVAGARLATDSVTSPGPSGTTPWTHFTIDVRLDSTVESVNLLLSETGAGTAWFADLALDLDGKSVTSLPTPGRVPTAAEMNWLRHVSFPFSGLNVGAALTDLAPIKTIIGSAHVIALGEGTHGTSEFIRIKQRLTEYAARELGVTVFALEEDQLVAQRINQYVQGGTGTASAAMRGGYTTWRTPDHIAFIEWMRRFNASGKGRLEFVGIDIADPQLEIDSVLAFVARVDPSYAAFAEGAYADVRAAWVNEDWRRPDTVYTSWRRNASAVLAHLAAHRAEYARSTDTSQIGWAIQNANVVYQATLEIVPVQTAGALLATNERLRDSCMAENLRWQMNRHVSGVRAIISAHNSHVSRAPGRMGGFLDKAYGSDMRVIATTTNAGSYLANVAEGRPLAKRRYEAILLTPGSPASMEGILHQLGQPRLLVDLRGASTDSLGHFLLDYRPFRWSGADVLNWAFQIQPVARFYDALVFIERTTSLKRLYCPNDVDCTVPRQAPTDR